VAVSRPTFAKARRAGGVLAPGYVDAVAEWLAEDLTRDYWSSMKIATERREQTAKFFLRVPDLLDYVRAFDRHDKADE